jgi:Terminase small subunit
MMSNRKITTKDTVETINSDKVIDLANHRLTLKRQAFVRAYIENGGNASAAYRKAYDASNMSDDAIRVEASRLRRNPNVTLTIERFHQSKAVGTMLTLEAHMTKLRELRDTAMANGKLGAAVRAEYLRGKAAGLYDRLEHSAPDEFARMTNEELREYIVDQTKALEALGIDVPALMPKADAKKH